MKKRGYSRICKCKTIIHRVIPDGRTSSINATCQCGLTVRLLRDKMLDSNTCKSDLPTKKKTSMKQYIEKKTGRRVKAIQCLPGVQHSILPLQFGEDTTPGSKVIACDDARGEIGDWLVVCAETGKFQFFKPCVFPHHFVESSVAGKPKPEVQPELPLGREDLKPAIIFENELAALITKHVPNGATMLEISSLLELYSLKLKIDLIKKIEES